MHGPVTAALGRHDLLPVAGVAAQRRRLHLAVVQASDPDVAGLQAVDAGHAVVGDAGGQHPSSASSISRRGRYAAAASAGMPRQRAVQVGVPALTGIDDVELGALLALGEQERGCRHPAPGTARHRERRAFPSGRSPPDGAPAAGAGPPEPGVQPVVPHAAAHPETLEEAADEHDEVHRAGAARSARCPGLRSWDSSRGRRSARAGPGHRLGGRRPGELEGTALPGAEPEFQHHLERARDR